MSETITFKELKRLTFCNSPELLGKKYIVGKTVHEWEGIGFVECDENPDPETHITVVD